MTIYICAHPSHRRGVEVGSVDVTAQVRLERALLPKPEAYLAVTEDVLAAVRQLDDGPNLRVGRIEQLISGVAGYQDLPVVLMSRGSITKESGRYELDDLRGAEPSIDRVAARGGAPHMLATPAGDDLVIIDDEPVSGPASPEAARAPTALLTRQPQRTQIIIPQGVFRLDELAASLAIADSTEPALIDAIRSTPLYDARTSLLGGTPWRVVITCPKAEASPAATHDMLFTGTGDLEVAVAHGTPVDAWDAQVEGSALLHMSPGAETSRAERRIWTLIGVEGFIMVALLAFGWLSGGLGLAARETPGWLGLSLVLGGSAIAFASIPLFAGRDPAANMNDTLVLQGLYESRASMFRWAAAISAVLFGLALMAGVIPPLLLEGRAIPAAAVTFDTSSRPIIATMRVSATGVGADDSLNVTMRGYGANDRVGTLVGQVTRQGGPSGVVSWTETFALDASARYVSVLVTSGQAPGPQCGPFVTGAAGCTVLAVPQLTSGAMTSLVVPATITLATAPTVTPAASVFPSSAASPSATSSPTP